MYLRVQTSSYLTLNRFPFINSIEIFVPLVPISPRVLATSMPSLASFRIFNYHDRCFDIRSEHYLIATRTTLFLRIYTFQFQKELSDQSHWIFRPWHTDVAARGSGLLLMGPSRKIDIVNGKEGAPFCCCLVEDKSRMCMVAWWWPGALAWRAIWSGRCER